MRSLYNQHKEDFDNMSIDLITCLKLDPNLHYVKSKLQKVSIFNLIFRKGSFTAVIIHL